MSMIKTFPEALENLQKWINKTIEGDEQAKLFVNEVVVRGGAWNYRPKHSAAYVRNSYFAWQPANNVGFRVIIEE